MAVAVTLVVSVMPAAFALLGAAIVYYTFRNRRHTGTAGDAPPADFAGADADSLSGDSGAPEVDSSPDGFAAAEAYGPVGYVVGVLFFLVGAVPLAYLWLG